MISLETQTAIKNAIWRLVQSDKVLVDLFGQDEVPLYLTWAPRDAEMPYMVHRMQNRSEDPWVVRSAKYYLDIWHYGDTAAPLYQIAGRMTEILERAVLGLSESGGYTWVAQTTPTHDMLVAARFFLVRDGDVPEPTENVWHYAMEFDIRYTRTIGQIERIIGDRK